MQDYMQLHAEVVGGKLPQRHLMSIAFRGGIADRLAGLITQFWHAVLTRRAFSTATYGTLPGWEAVCSSPFVNWTVPATTVPSGVFEFAYKSIPGHSADNLTLPPEMTASKYQILHAINEVEFYSGSNLSSLMEPDPEYILGACNRGRTYHLAHNPYYKQQLGDFGVNPINMFMCGFFALCSPVDPIVDYYKTFWDVLSAPGTLRIGVQVRTGDHVFGDGESDSIPEEALAQGDSWFQCAQAIEDKFATPGQPVLWFLNSDSKQLRKAAKAKYGAKLVTDDELSMTHPDCVINKDKQSCEQSAMDLSFQHSLGSILTFSMVDYHVISTHSGFGRLGAWLSGR
jgi:hypothetical protein